MADSGTAFRGTAVRLSGGFLKQGDALPEFKLLRNDLSEAQRTDFTGRRVAFIAVPSLDTGVCASEAKRFDQEASAAGDAALLVVSRDLPFAQKRFCEEHQLQRITTLSAFREAQLGQRFGIELADSPLAGLLARAIFVTDAQHRVVYTQLVPEITQEPDYAAVLEALRNA